MMVRRFTLFLCSLLAAGLVMLGDTAHAQGIRVRAVNLIPAPTGLDYFLTEVPGTLVEDLQYEYTSPLSGSLPVPAGTYTLKIAPSGAGVEAAIATTAVPITGGNAYSVVAYGTEAAPRLKAIERSLQQVIGAGKAMFRVFNASTYSSSFDIYTEAITGTPMFAGVARDMVSQATEITAGAVTVHITATGSTTSLARLTASITPGSYTTLIITGSAENNLKVYALNENAQDGSKLQTLETQEGFVPSLRVVHGFQGTDARKVDVYLNDILKMDKLNYRSASNEFPGVVPGNTAVKFTLAGSPADEVYTANVKANEDTAYSVILTQFRTGSPVALVLERHVLEGSGSIGSAKVRVANASDIADYLTFVVTPMQGDSLKYEDMTFLSSTEWATITPGMTLLRVYRSGETTPIFEGQHDIQPSSLATLVALGEGANFTVDILNEGEVGPQEPMQSFGEEEVSVPFEPAPAATALRLRNAPNPVTTSTVIGFDLPASSSVTLDLYDALGRGVATILDGHREAGEQRVTLDATGIPTGVYTCVLRIAGQPRATQRIVIAH